MEQMKDARVTVQFPSSFGSAKQVQVGELLERTPRDAYHTAVHSLRCSVNAPLQQVAVCFRVSPSRVSKIQRTVESGPLTSEQVEVFTRCKVKD